MSFEVALNRYRRARRAAESEGGNLELVTARIDKSLDVLMATASPSAQALGEKLLVLEAEYGVEPQRRHMPGIYRDARLIVQTG